VNGSVEDVPVPVRLICDVLALKVKFVVVAKFIAVGGEPVPLNVTVLEPNVIVLLLVLLELRAPAVTLKLAVLNVPEVTVSIALPILSASAKVAVIPKPLIVRPPSVLPLLVSVPVASNVGISKV
jgi:hypothetical protein